VMLALRRLMGAVGLLESVIVGRPGVGVGGAGAEWVILPAPSQCVGAAPAIPNAAAPCGPKGLGDN